MAPDLGGVQDMQDIEPEGKEAKATPASIKKLRRATTDLIEQHHKEWQEANAEDDEDLAGTSKPKTLKTKCIVCEEPTEYNPEYQTAEKTTCSPDCFLKDYAKNQDKLSSFLDAIAKDDELRHIWDFP